MITKKTKIISLILSLGCSLPSFSSAEQYYKWVDSKGVTNYSARPPASNTKKKKISTVDTYADGNHYQKPQRQFQSNSGIPDTQYQYYSNNSNAQQYRASAPPQRSEADEVLRQKAIKEASTVMPGAKGLTANQRSTLAAMNGGVDSVGGYSNSNSPHSVPTQQRPPSTITNCDGAGCWGTDGTRYNKAAGNTYFSSNGGACQAVSSEMNCN